MTPYALNCGDCNGAGWVGDTMCEACGGVGKILVGKDEPQSKWPRVFAWVLFLGAVGVACYLLVTWR
jgi:hypothetical protein